MRIVCAERDRVIGKVVDTDESPAYGTREQVSPLMRITFGAAIDFAHYRSSYPSPHHRSGQTTAVARTWIENSLEARHAGNDAVVFSVSVVSLPAVRGGGMGCSGSGVTASGSVVLFEADHRSRTRVSGSRRRGPWARKADVACLDIGAETGERACRVSLILRCNSFGFLRSTPY